MTTRETTLFCARQIECILRYVQNVYRNQPMGDNHKRRFALEDHLASAMILLEELGRRLE